MTGAEALPPTATSRLVADLGLTRTPEVTRTWTGATSTVVVWDDLLTVKVPHRDGTAVASCLTHARVSPVARRLGLRSPEVLLVTEPDDVVPVPVVVSTYLPGARPRGDGTESAVWSDVGSQLALLHAADPSVVPAGLRRFSQHPEVHPDSLATALGTAGALDAPTVNAVRAVRDRLAPLVLGREHQVLCHGDVHAGNVLATQGRYAGMLDLAGAGWLDAAWDFVGMPLRGVGAAVAGYRAAGGGTEGLVPRIAWCRLQTALHGADPTTGAAAATTRALRQVTALLDDLR